MDDIGVHIDNTDQSLDELGRIVADLATSRAGSGHDAFHEAITEWFASARDCQISCTGFAPSVNAHDNFWIWNNDTQGKIKEIIDGLSIVGLVLVIGSVLTDGGLDVLIVGVIEALDLFGVEAGATLAIPIAEVAATAEAILITAGGAVAITQGVVHPDDRIDGKVFDNYAPSTGRARNIEDEMAKKVAKEQTDRIILNLADSPVDLNAMRAQLHDWPISGLKEAIAIDKQGNILHLYP